MFKFVMTKNSIELFHRAILSNDLQRTKLILEEAMKDPRFNIDEINDEGLTALQFSCFAGNLDIVKVLVSFKADAKKRDRDGNTLLHASALAGNADVVKYLLRCSLKPIVRNDDHQMPVDLTDEVAVIVILLRSMLDQGYLQEMQEYMLDHPKLKRNIFKELERVKCRENEKNEILKELPYSSHTSPRRHSNNRNQRLSSSDLQGRSISTFSKLSDSMQHLNELSPQHTRNDHNNNHVNKPHQHQHRNSTEFQSYNNNNNTAPMLKRHNSTSSSSSHGSRSSRGSGILRHDIPTPATGENDPSGHHQTQQYLESRFPPHLPKSVSFELDHQANQRCYSDGYISDTYDDKISANNNGRPSSRSSSISSHSSSHTGVFNDSCSNLDFPSPRTPTSPQDEIIYQNVQSLNLRTSSSLPTISEGENIYENLPLRNSSPKPNAPPPLPPRIPAMSHRQQQPPSSQQQQYNHSNPYEYEESYLATTTTERQMGSETDSGIDINETAGRMFALSLEEQNNAYNNYNSSNSSNATSPLAATEQQTYSRPIGIYYTDEIKAAAPHRHSSSNVLPTSNSAPVFLRPNTGSTPAHLNPKYRSWNGRTLLETQQQHRNNEHNDALNNGVPYASRRQQKHSRDDYDASYRTKNGYQQHNQHTISNRELNRSQEHRQFTFDHQPEIML